MCGCGLNDSLAATPARSIMRANPAVVNGAPRSDVHLTEAEVERLIKATKDYRHGQRDATMILAAYRHASDPGGRIARPTACSRVRRSRFGGLLGVTVRKTVRGVTSCKRDFVMISSLSARLTVRMMPFLGTVARHVSRFR
jgi:hypothetical protein